ncbi:MAG TPA: YraN family protein [Candidatus Competibacteraceae bacterium]|nr:YraN family protein [Candidatus Competibacteraceae bacterium]
MMTAKAWQGKQGEELACRYLSARGLRLVQRNYRCGAGELDLIMRDGATLVFVEVRWRAPNRYASAAETITPTKRRRLILAARHYLLRLGADPPCRFDVIAIDGSDAPALEWIRDAFRAD